MKYICLQFMFCFLFLSNLSTYAQVHKFITTEFKSRKIHHDKKSPWTDWQSVDYVITLDQDNEIITISSKGQKDYNFRLVGYIQPQKEDDGIITLLFYSINEEGGACEITFLRYPNENKQFYFSYTDKTILFNVEKFQ